MSRSLKPSPLARQGDVPLYRQIYEHFRRAIADGQLSSGDRLPSCRRLAEQFATARGTVDAAYAMLAGEGYVVSRGPAGTIVSPDLGARPFVKVTARRPLSAGPDTICQDCAQSILWRGENHGEVEPSARGTGLRITDSYASPTEQQRNGSRSRAPDRA